MGTWPTDIELRDDQPTHARYTITTIGERLGAELRKAARRNLRPVWILLGEEEWQALQMAAMPGQPAHLETALVLDYGSSPCLYRGIKLAVVRGCLQWLEVITALEPASAEGAPPQS